MTSSRKRFQLSTINLLFFFLNDENHIFRCDTSRQKTSLNLQRLGVGNEERLEAEVIGNRCAVSDCPCAESPAAVVEVEEEEGVEEVVVVWLMKNNKS